MSGVAETASRNGRFAEKKYRWAIVTDSSLNRLAAEVMVQD
jgi:hypothetical protein